MITGFSAPDFPFAKIPTEEIARKMLDQYPQFSNILRTTGEGSQDFNFYNSADRAYIDGFLNLAKYLDVPVIVVLNSYNELLANDRAEITRKSNMAIVNEVVKSGVKVYCWAIANELYSKPEFHGWVGTYTNGTVSNINKMKSAAYRYMIHVEEYERLIGANDNKFALCMATDLNISRKTWDSALFEAMDKSCEILDAHIYPDRTVVGTALSTLIKKRLGRGHATGAELICGELNTNMGMYGTEKIDPYSKSPKHLAHLNSIIGEVEKYATVVCVHKLGSIQPNNYSMINFAA